ncbi:BrnT family toxin [Desulfonema magnum]|uniref:Toxin-antitoxin system, toxin component, type II BrnT n=1 Tax=Desulfonema magnum TaxID=45655 RepID=A0A975BKF8_9BACT|nr:BrnT family toxin [Desulfonema magnum]QTA87038.1 Putative toxin-antitoxin system, toxin component, type II BrnT [Desulfonema magnum]
MDIGFVWDETKYKAVIKKHNVRFYEVVSAFDDPEGYEVSDPAGHEDRWLWVGQTHQYRVLTVICTEEELPLYRIVTASDAEGRWPDEYRRRQGV